MGRPRYVLAAAAAVLVAVFAVPASAGTAAKLSAKERKAIQIESVEVFGEESLGILVTAKFGGNITKVLGRGSLRKARTELILRPSSPEFDPARIAAKGPGIIGQTVADTRSKKVGVVRDGRTLMFFNFGPGYSNVATTEVRVDVPSGTRGARMFEKRDETSGQVPVPHGGLSCSDLVDELDDLDAALDQAREAKRKALKALEIVEKLIRKHEPSLFGKALQLVDKVNPASYILKWLDKGHPPLEESLAKMRKTQERLEEAIKDQEAIIDALEAARKKVKAKIRECSNGGSPPPSPCTASLVRSPGTAPYTAANHIRVRASCTAPIRQINVSSLSGDTFDACAQTAGTGTGCTASAASLSSTWNGTANEIDELYGRVTANADGGYNVSILGDGNTVLHQFEATVPAV